MTDTDDTAGNPGIVALERALHRDLSLLDHPPASWVLPGTVAGQAPAADVVIVGGGMCGLVAAFALARQGVHRVQVLDARDAGREGPWVTYARMRTLRSPKHLTGPALGLPRLTFRAWFEAHQGREAWEALGRIPREQWMDYLGWYRRVLHIPVRNGARVSSVRPAEGGFVVDVEGGDGPHTLHARKVVIATGREGMARARIPPPFTPYLGTRVQHSCDDIDFDALAGRTVAVVGLGASAFDNAACALEAGAARVHLLARTAAMPRVNKAKSIVYPGFVHGFPELPPARRLAILGYIARCKVAPPRSAVLRIAGHAGFRLHLASPVESVIASGDGLVLHTPHEALQVDRVILGTGFRIDVDAAPELAALAPAIRRWRDGAGVPAQGPEEEEFLEFPFLGPAFECRARDGHDAPWCADLHCFNLAAWLSLGYLSSDIPAVSEGADRLARGIARDLFLADVDRHEAHLHGYEDPELLGDEMPDLDEWWPPVKR